MCARSAEGRVEGVSNRKLVDKSLNTIAWPLDIMCLYPYPGHRYKLPYIESTDSMIRKAKRSSFKG